MINKDTQYFIKEYQSEIDKLFSQVKNYSNKIDSKTYIKSANELYEIMLSNYMDKYTSKDDDVTKRYKFRSRLKLDTTNHVAKIISELNSIITTHNNNI